MSTITNDIEQQVAIINNSVSVFNQAPEILTNNQIRVTKAVEVGEKILEAIEANGGQLDADLDARAMNYLNKCSAAVTELKNGRAPVTQIMDELKKMYTTLENTIDVKKDGTIAAQIQKYRNEYAAKLAAEKKRKEEEAQRKLDTENEKIDIRAHVENQINLSYGQYLLNAKQKLQNKFNGATLDDIDEIRTGLEQYEPELKETSYMAMVLPKPPIMRYHTADELVNIQNTILAEKYSDQRGNYIAEMTMKRDEIIDLLPSKKTELLELKRLADEAEALRIENERKEAERKQALAEADAKEKKRLEKEQEKQREAEKKEAERLENERQQALKDQKAREDAEAQRLLDEQQLQQEKDEQAVEMKASGDKTMAMFDKEAEVAEHKDAPATRQGFDIVVGHAAGYVQLFTLWFDKVGKDLPLEKLGKTSLDQMKSWAEKHAHKTSEKIDSKFLEYVPTYKAVNVKSK